MSLTNSKGTGLDSCTISKKWYELGKAYSMHVQEWMFTGYMEMASGGYM